MSVIVRLPDGTIRMYIKGADDPIKERLVPGQGKDVCETTWRHLEEYSNEGLRTLVLAYKDIPEKDFTAWFKKYKKARVSLKNRDAKVFSNTLKLISLVGKSC